MSSFNHFQFEDFIYTVIPLGGSISLYSTIILQCMSQRKEFNQHLILSQSHLSPLPSPALSMSQNNFEKTLSLI